MNGFGFIDPFNLAFKDQFHLHCDQYQACNPVFKMKALIVVLLSAIPLVFGDCDPHFKSLDDASGMCYFIRDDWLLHWDAKRICRLLNASLYIPPEDSPLRYRNHREFRKYLTHNHYWSGIERKIDNWTLMTFHWVDGNTGENMTYDIFDEFYHFDPRFAKISERYMDRNYELGPLYNGDRLQMWNMRYRKYVKNMTMEEMDETYPWLAGHPGHHMGKIDTTFE